ncbi:MAG: hypothetical protein GX419_12035 [Bacteroidales bacterium]|nr:hypothetical protein [Bacteroidales bacterium]
MMNPHCAFFDAPCALVGRFHSVSAGFARIPPLKAKPLRIGSLELLMRNPG